MEKWGEEEVTKEGEARGDGSQSGGEDDEDEEED